MNAAQRYIVIVPAKADDTRAGRFEVWNTLKSELCGTIRWYFGFRSYAFFPTDGFLFDSNCMRIIADFMDEARIAYLKKNKIARESKV